MKYGISVLLTFGMLGVISTSGSAQDASRVVGHDEALQMDAEALSASYGVSREDAARRLKLQAAAGDGLIEQLRKEFAPRLAGIYIEHSPRDRLVVRLKGDEPVASRRLEVGKDVLLVEFISGQKYSKKEIDEIMKRHKMDLRKSIPGLQGMYANERTGDAELVVRVNKNDFDEIKRLHDIAEKILGIPVRIYRVSAPVTLDAREIRGGGSLPNLGCTTGFVVKEISNSKRGVLTAGHCNGYGTTLYTDHDGHAGFVQYKDRAYSATEDVEWYGPAILTPSSAFKPQFYFDFISDPRPLTGRRTQANTCVGNNICHYGNTTGYSCGDVHSIDYDQAYCFPYECEKTWIAVVPPASSTPGLACYGGDSGGPWFISTVALGIHHSSIKTGPEIGACDMAFYMSTDRINVLGVQLLYTP